MAKFSPECCVICLIYINRILVNNDIPLNSKNWRPLVFLSLITAHKMWDYSTVSNDFFADIFHFFDTEQLNVLEMKFLELIQYDTYVKFSTYSNYFLELKNVTNEELPIKQNDMFTMAKLEKDSKEHSDKLSKYAKTVGKSIEFGMSTKFIIS